MSRNKGLTDTLNLIARSAHGKTVSFGDIIEALKYRGFGTLLIAPAMIAAMPTGAVPGVPAICGIMIALVSAQMVFGRRYPWFPKAMREFSFDRAVYEKAVRKARPVTRYIDHFFKPRLRVLLNPLMQRVIAGLCLVLGCVMVGLGFIPGLPLILAAAILMFALGLSVHDGLVLLGGFAMLAAGGAAIPLLR